jgi:hypothetical protein
MSYGYKRSTTEQLQNSVIDWAGITKNVSDRIIKETERRDNLKAELETTYNNQLDTLNDYQQGLDVEANAFMMQQVQNHKAFLKQNHDLMKAGLRSVNDNKLIQTNVSNTWTRLNSAMKGHQEAFKKFSESGKTGDLALAEFLADSINVKDKQIYLSETGEGYLAAVDDKGVIDKSSLQAIRSIEQVQASEWDSIDVNAAVIKDANGAAVWKEAFSSTFDVENVRNNPAFKEWKENTITKSLNNDQRLFSVLTDYMGYDYTYNPDEVDENTVLLKKDKNNGFPTPELTPEQTAKARDAYGNALEMALGKKEDKQYVAPTQTDYKRSDAKKSKEATFNTIIAALQGDQDKFKTIFDPYEQARATIGGGENEEKLSILGKDPIEIKSGTTISGAGGRIAAQLGFSAEEFEKYVSNRNLSGVQIDPKVREFESFDTTKDLNIRTETNVQKLNKALVLDIDNNEITLPQTDPEGLKQISRSFENKLMGISVGTGVPTSVDDQGNVTIGTKVIRDGINNIQDVLNELQRQVSDGGIKDTDSLYTKKP